MLVEVRNDYSHARSKSQNVSYLSARYGRGNKAPEAKVQKP